ncbi:MAG: hypothetical protein PHS32_10770 [Rhodoferax sp.]|uniref:hypothetical protein n=1 Tax=Rhodoferax sp. TaxID=50421 RepID=UPI0026282424|nr:hypothetical protein [Rhodoferax sp.]MDD5334214.1 hypothetical protein [Rhodoferax sp.]
MSELSRPSAVAAIFGLRPRLAPPVGTASDSTDAVLGGRPGFFLSTTSAAAGAAAVLVISAAGVLLRGSEAGTVLTLNSVFFRAVLAAALAGADLGAGLAEALTTGVATDLTGFFDF